MGVVACITGVALHLPMFFGAKDMHYVLSGMTPEASASMPSWTNFLA